jgi:hypothetical protein
MFKLPVFPVAGWYGSATRGFSAVERLPTNSTF